MALILAIFAVALLTTLAVGITSAVRVELLAAHTGLERMQDLFLAQAGIDVARAILFYENVTFDALDDLWGPYCESPLDWPRKLGNGYYRVRVYDACGRIDVNHAQYPTLARLIGDAALAEEIVRWRDARASGSYYEALAYPYQPRRGPFQSLGELLLVEGMTPELFFGSDQDLGLVELLTVEALSPNTDANGDKRVGVREISSALGAIPDQWEQWIKDHHSGLLDVLDLETWKKIFLNALNLPGGRYTSLGQLALVLESYGALSALDHFSVTSGERVAGLVNLNTASSEVIAALPGGSPGLADAIVAQRETMPFVSLGEVAEFLVSQAGGPQVLLDMIDHVTTKSASFIVESMGSIGTGRSFRTLRALVRRSEDNVHVVQQFQKDYSFPPPDEAVSLAARR